MSRRGRCGVTALVAFLLAAGCTDRLAGPQPADDPETNFELLWREFDRLYALFPVRRVDWDSLYAVHRPRVRAGMSDAELFGVMASLLAPLEDGHVMLQSTRGIYWYDGWYRRYPANFDSRFIPAYLNGARRSEGGQLYYGRIGQDIGYIHVQSFGGQGWSDQTDTALEQLGDVRALVVDVRNNGGGSDRMGRDVAGRFADASRPYRVIRYRNGPRRDDFTPPIRDRIEPLGARRFTGPIAVLTNRRVYSAAEDFVLAMGVMPHVMVVGDTTGGGFGNPITRELPNGWTFSVPRWILESADGEQFEGIGIPPDHPVRFTSADVDGRTDTILEAAVRLLRDRVGS